ncbi:hypothetical protein FEM41_04160 [Jejubacter calystegiae]|uniref:Uncharacterized protein n=1 Tax=Jejubacter calystegiae TaxID=2579935 RepID=A0A4P8YEC0_9ENTR|nr:hypothetical protein [Jejubacter calystegiae]QCT18899.1 hypothetical protein FEM41_04160 [Jejubacter calystegiae]
MNIYSGSYIDVLSISQSTELVGILANKSQTIHADTPETLYYKLRHLNNLLNHTHPTGNNHTVSDILDIAIDIESNIFETLGVIEEIDYTLRIIIDELHIFTSTLYRSCNP